MAPTQQSPFLRAIKTILTVLAIIAGSVGATVFYMSHVEKTEAANAAKPLTAQGPAPAIPGPIFVALDPFTVTLRDDYTKRILYAAITLRVSDEASRQLLTEYMPEVRDRVLLALAKQDPKTVQAPETRQLLSQSLAKVLEAPYLPQPQHPQITHVLFTAFVVQ